MRTTPRLGISDLLVSRREALRVCATAACGGLIAGAAPPATQTAGAAARAQVIPVNPLGRTGVKVTRLAMGAGYPSYDRRLLEFAYRNGIRYFDNAYGYGNGRQEATLGQWAAGTGRRGDVFLATKDGVCPPDLFYRKVITRLKAMGVDTLDMMLIHGIEDPSLPLDRGGEWRRLKDRLVREKRIRFMGFSTHASMPARIECVANAARSGWIDAVMVPCDPLVLRTNGELNRALDACVKSGVGLIAMKTTRGLGRQAALRRGLKEGEARTETMPGFDPLGLSAFGAVHYGVWSDGRFATICSAMLNLPTIEENTRNARQFSEPLNEDQRRLLEEGMRKLARRTCPGCDGACNRAAGVAADFAPIARCLAYCEEDGSRDFARALYARLAAERKAWRGADLRAASRACWAGLDFKAILERAERLLG
jgi:predicted aldo/keto reductase-like oxidoreductase